MSGLFNFAWKIVLPIAAVFVGFSTGQITGGTVVTLAAIAVVLLIVTVVVVALSLRYVGFAAWLGRVFQAFVNWTMRTLKKEERDDVVQIVVDFRELLIIGLRDRWVRALGATFLQYLSTFLVLVLALRLAGLGADVLSVTDVFIAFGITQLILVIPITPGNAGVAEAAYISLLTILAGDQYADAIAVGVFLFRIATWLLAIPVGWLVFFGWTKREGHGHGVFG